ncbi:hypothetical protein [Krasilnikovia sp. MM14-A1259]|uniref:hypothetical protein n=1 Tax=Krasilnikovia sp. MM14-A1259 TaxID=3373539 RepID=UPI0037FD6388
MRSRLAALGAGIVLCTLAGCSRAAADPGPPPVQVVEQPAASAGGACILWDYAFIRDKIGVTFTVAGSDQVDDTSTCVVQTENGDYPNLALSVVESTSADADVFLKDLMPAKATKVKGLGRAGYRLVSRGSGGHGPSIEISWLSQAAQLQTLKFTFPKDAKPDQVDQMSTRLVSLANAMNTTSG